MVVLRTERLVISDHVPEDLMAMHDLLSDPVAMCYLDDIRTATIEQTRENLDVAIRESRAHDRRRFFFKVELDDRYAGEVGYTVTDGPDGRVANLGFFILPAYWGMGIATEAAREVVRFAFEETGVMRVQAGCFSDNVASERVMMKLGMTRDSDCRRIAWHGDRLKDRVEYGLERAAWMALKE